MKSMTNKNDQDLAIEALLDAARDMDTDLPDGFIKATYAIQRRHQFNQDQTISLQDLVKLVEDHLIENDAK